MDSRQGTIMQEETRRDHLGKIELKITLDVSQYLEHAGVSALESGIPPPCHKLMNWHAPLSLVCQ